MKKLLAEENLASATEETLNELEHFMQRFKVEEPDEIEPFQAIETLKQATDQSLTEYYNQCNLLLKELGGSDNYQDDNKMAKSPLKMVVTKFISGLADPTLQTRMAGYAFNTDCTLRGVYTKAHMEVQKMQARHDIVEKNRQQTELTLLNDMRTYIINGQAVPTH